MKLFSSSNELWFIDVGEVVPFSYLLHIIVAPLDMIWLAQKLLYMFVISTSKHIGWVLRHFGLMYNALVTTWKVSGMNNIYMCE